jgi:hypothetical protein
MPILPWRAWRNRPVPNARGTKPPGEKFARSQSRMIYRGVIARPQASVAGQAIRHSGVPSRPAIRSGAGRAKESPSHKAAERRVSGRQAASNGADRQKWSPTRKASRAARKPYPKKESPSHKAAEGECRDDKPRPTAPTAKMVAYAQSLARGKKVTLPKGYQRDFRECRRFLDEHAR